jgi:hypothetical protein
VFGYYSIKLHKGSYFIYRRSWVLNNIAKIIPQGKLKIPAVGLLVTVGVLGLGVIGSKTTVNIKSTVIAADLPGYTNQIQSGNENSLLSRLRGIKNQRSQMELETVEANTEVPIEALNINIQSIPTNTKPLAKQSPVNFPEKDGIYLYGQSSVANQLGQGYIVFKKHQGQVIGALYMPSSEFSCFQGTIAKSGELAMTVTSSPGETGVTQVSTNSRIPRLYDEDAVTYAHSIALQDYHQLQSVSENDRQILQTCSQDLNRVGQ